MNAATMPAPQLAMLLAQSAGGEPVAVSRWNAAMRAPGHGRLPGSPPDKAVLEIAASIAGPAISVRPGARLPHPGRRASALITSAITTASR